MGNRLKARTYYLFDGICALFGHAICGTPWGQRLFSWWGDFTDGEHHHVWALRYSVQTGCNSVTVSNCKCGAILSEPGETEKHGE